MFSKLLDTIIELSQYANNHNTLESTLEHHMNELIAQQHPLKISLAELMRHDKRETETPLPGFAMGLTYLATAAVLCESSARSENAALVLDVVELHLLAPNSTAHDQLRGHRSTLERFEELLCGYITLLDICDAGNYRRKLYYLHQAAVRFTPSSESLSVAHPLLVREAARAHCPAPALSVMSQPIMDVSPDDTGAGIINFLHYYYEGGMLLAGLRCWEDAAAWFRSALSLSPRVVYRMIDHSGEQAVDTVLLRSKKALVLVSIILHGELSDPDDRKQARDTIQQFRGGSVGPYLRFLSAASQRNGRMWEMVETQSMALWKRDELMELVTEAGLRLQRHVIRDLAHVANRVYIRDIISALHKHELYTPRNETDDVAAVVDLLLTMQEEGELLVSIEYVKSADEQVGEEAEVETKCSNEKGMDREELVVCLAIPPARVSVALGICRKGVDGLCLTEGERRQLVQARLGRALEERIQRCERARNALLKATELTVAREIEMSTGGRVGERGRGSSNLYRGDAHVHDNEEMGSNLTHTTWS